MTYLNYPWNLCEITICWGAHTYLSIYRKHVVYGYQMINIDVIACFVIYYLYTNTMTLCNSWMKYLRCERSQLKLRSKKNIQIRTYTRRTHRKNFAHISIGARLRGSSNGSNKIIIITARHSPFLCIFDSQNIPPDFSRWTICEKKINKN